MSLKLKFNSPVVLTIATLATVAYVLDFLSGGSLKYAMALGPHFEWSVVPRTLTYVLAHGSIDHLLGNLGIFLLVGPALEHRYGWLQYLGMTVACAVLTAVFHILVFDEYLIGLSGVVFMNIILASFTNVKRGEVPLTFLLVLVLFLGRELLEVFRDDQVSQFAHIMGGLIGSALGFKYAKT